jgi:hypothetical protein
MGKEFAIDNLEDMCALMCDNVVPKHVTLRSIDEIPQKSWGKGAFRSKEIQRYVEEFIDLGTRYAEVNVSGQVDVNNLRRMFQRECDDKYVMYGIQVVKRGDRIFLKRW